MGMPCEKPCTCQICADRGTSACFLGDKLCTICKGEGELDTACFSDGKRAEAKPQPAKDGTF